MVQHAGVHVAHGVAAAADDEAFQKIYYLCWMEDPVISVVIGGDTKIFEWISSDD